MNTAALIESYFESFNSKNWDSFFALLSEDVTHDINQGKAEVGKVAFRKFMDHMNVCYDESIVDRVVMVDASGKHACCQFTCKGRYLTTDGSFPAARGQTYALRGASVFELDQNKVKRVTTYYNLNEWLSQIS